jgi:hypothetical protein
MGLAAATLLYAAITAVLFRTLLPDLGTHLFSDPGDPLLLAAIIGWNATHLPLSEAWWNFPSFAPVEGVTAFTEHMLLSYPVASPIVWLTGNPVLAYNIVYLLAKPLNAAAAFGLGRELTGSSAAAWIGGLAFAFAPYQAIHVGHLQLMLSFGMPLMLLWLHRYLHGGGRRALVGIATGWLVTGMANAYLLVFFPFVVVLYCLWFVRLAEWRRLVPPVVAVALATLAMAPLLWGYHVRLAAFGFARQMGEIRAFSADVVGLAGMFHANTAWRSVLPHDFEERAMFPGFTIVVLAAVALYFRNADRRLVSSAGTPVEAARNTVWSRRLAVTALVVTVVVLARVQTGPWGWHLGPVPLPPFDPHRVFSLAFLLFVISALISRWFREAWMDRNAVAFFGVALFLLWLLALGPLPEWSTPWRFITYGPYWLLMALPGMDAVRVPSRIWLIAVLCLAMLAAYGAKALLRRYGHRPQLAVVALSLLILVEGWFGGGTVEAPRPMPAGAIPQGAVVLDLPIVAGYPNAIPQYRAVLGGYRTINGYSGYEPPFFEPFLAALDTQHHEAIDTYLRTGDLYVIVRADVDPALVAWLTSLPGTTQLTTSDGARIYRLPRRSS